MRPFLLITLLFGLVSAAVGQNKKADSLRTVLTRHPQADTFRVNRLNELAAVLFSNQALSDSLTNKALQLSQKLHYAYGEVHALMRLSNNANRRGNLALQQQQADKAFQLAQKVGDKKLLLAAYLNLHSANMFRDGKDIVGFFQQSINLARELNDSVSLLLAEVEFSYWYHNRGNYPAALQQGLLALQTTEKTKPPSQLQSLVWVSMATYYTKLKEYDQALSFYRRALSMPSPPGEPAVVTNNRRLTVLSNSIDLYIRMKRYAEAERNCLQILQTKEPGWGKSAKIDLSYVYERQGRYDLAFPLAFSVLEESQRTNDENSLGNIYIVLQAAYLHTNRPDSSVYYGLKVLRYTRQANFKEEIRNCSDQLAQAYAQLRDFPNAYKYLRTFVTYQDSLTYEEFRQKATVARFNGQLKQQQIRIASLNKTRQLEAQAARRQQILLYFILGTLLLLAVLAFVLFRNNRQKRKANALLNKQKQQIEYTLTELKQTQVQLIQKEKLASLGELTAGIAHEIQNPLNFVNNFSEVSAELVSELVDELDRVALGKGDVEEAKALATDLGSNLRKINHHGQRASSIVKGMLEHSRASSGEKQPTNLNALADEYLKIAYHGQRANNQSFNCELITDFEATVGKVDLIPQDIGRVLLNLYNNAFYAVHEKQKTAPAHYQPRVTVSTQRRESGVEIRVKDNGTGIPDVVKAKIFQPFFTTKPTGEGTGLGLSLSYDIVTKGHSGTLTVESEPNQGTVFTTSLPLT